NPKSSEKLGKDVLNSSTVVDCTVGAPTKANSDCVNESLKEIVPETHVVSSVDTPLALETGVVPNVDTSMAEYSFYDCCTEKEPSVGKIVGDDPNVFIVNDIVSGDMSRTPEAGIARRTRRKDGKNVATVSTPVQISKSGKVTRSAGKKPMYGPPRTKSKNVAVTEQKKKSLKRKAPPTNDCEFELETDVAASSGTSRKSVGRKKILLSVPPAPLDNVFFHLKNGSDRWKFVFHRRLALEQNFKGDILKCQDVVDGIKHAGLVKTASDLGNCYDRLVKEFLINIAENCDDLENPEYKQVYVCGKCLHFSPTLIKQYLEKCIEEVAELEVTDDEICKTITVNMLKHWPRNSKLFATQFSPKYAILNKIAATSWVPTTHSSDVSKNLNLSLLWEQKQEKLIAFPTLLCSIILEQHPDILRSFDIPCKRQEKLIVDQKLLSRTTAAKNVGPSVSKKAGTLTRKQMIADLTESSRALEAMKLKVDRVIELDGQEVDAGSGSDGDTEKIE
ncbi:envelope-like protein, partial [Trifolium pratense]